MLSISPHPNRSANTSLNRTSVPLARASAGYFCVRRQMITVCHPVDDLELVFLRAALEAAEIPHFVVGQHFGSLYPGMQVPSYNERSVRVPNGYLEAALKIVNEVRSSYSPTFEHLTTKSKLRILLEGLFLGWVIPAGTKKPSNLSLNPD
jgi:Putative prokaryotic signal transducing protein